MLLHLLVILWISLRTGRHHANRIQTWCQEQNVWNVVHPTQQELAIANCPNGCKWSSLHFCASLGGTCLRQMDCLKKSKGKERAWVTPEKMKHPLETAGLFEWALFSQTIELHFSSIQLHMTWDRLWREIWALRLPSLPLSPFSALRHLSCA